LQFRQAETFSFQSNLIMTKSERLRLLSLVVIIGFGSSVLIHYWRGSYEGRPYPASTWLYRPDDRFEPAAGGTAQHVFGDFYLTLTQSKDPSPYRPKISFLPSNYFPFTHVCFRPLTALNFNVALAGFLGVTVIGVAVYVYGMLRVRDPLDDIKNVFVLTALTYPVQMVLDRGNIEGILFLLVALFLVSLQRNRLGASVVFLACAAAMKLYPALFALIYLARREYKAFAACALLTILLTTVSLATFEGGMVANAQGLWDALRSCDDHADIGTHVVQHGSSFHGMLRTTWFLTGRSGEPLVWFNRLNLLFTLTSLGLLFISHLKCRFSPWQSCALITFAIILVPKVSFDYKLILLYLPLGLFMNSNARRPGGLLYTLGFGLLLIPKGFWLIRDDVSINCLVSPLIMLAMAGGIVVSVYYRQRQSASVSADDDSLARRETLPLPRSPVLTMAQGDGESREVHLNCRELS
jgi:hypothetical protein